MGDKDKAGIVSGYLQPDHVNANLEALKGHSKRFEVSSDFSAWAQEVGLASWSFFLCAKSHLIRHLIATRLIEELHAFLAAAAGSSRGVPRQARRQGLGRASLGHCQSVEVLGPQVLLDCICRHECEDYSKYKHTRAAILCALVEHVQLLCRALRRAGGQGQLNLCDLRGREYIRPCRFL